MIALFKYLKGCHTEEGQDLFSILPEYRTGNNGRNLQEDRFQLDIRKNDSTTMEPVTQGGRELSHTRGIQGAAGQSFASHALKWIPALSRGLDSMALMTPPTLLFYDSKVL